MPPLRNLDTPDQHFRFAVPNTALPAYESPTYEDAASHFETATATAAASTPPNQLLLTEDPFSTEASRQLFDAIDQLRKCGAGQDLDLPELVIVGKQSSGKSSLLQSLTEIPFPSGDNSCVTRFATRIISRRSSPGTADLIKVSIEAGAVEHGDARLFGYADVDGRTGSFNPTVESFTSEGFLQIMKQAKEVMSITKDRNFSSKVLKIELSGPDRSHFAILDLPGIFESEFGGRTSREANGIRQLVTRYMKQPRNIIICVAEATDDLANQRIFQLANENIEDPSRMVGVFTKCDRLEKPDKTISIVNNHEGIGGVALNGWFVVRNRGSTEDDFSSADRQKEENALFSKHPWVEIPENRRGTAMLKRFLANLLCRRIREAFPGMQKAVQSLLQTEHEHLQILGKERSTQAQQQEFLRAIAQRFRALADQALKSPAELPFDNLKLRGMIQEMNASFALNLKKHGHLYEFSDIENGTRAEQQQRVSVDMKQNSDSESDSDSDNRPSQFNIQSVFHSRVSIPLTPERSPRRSKKKSPAATVHQQPSLYGEIKAQIKVNRGEELPGILNPSILKPLMRKQTSKWEGLAVTHSQHIAETTTAVAVRLLHTVCAEQGVPNYTRNGLEDLIRQTFGVPSERRLVKQISELCYRMATGLLQTNNESFLEKVRNSRRLRFDAALERYNHNVPGVNFFKTDITGPSPGLHNLVQQLIIISPTTIKLLFDELHSSQQKNTEDEIHDLLKAYYEVAQEDFIHDITTHVVEPFLNDASGPLMGFSPDFIMKELREDRIEELGGEDESAIMGRKDAAAKIKRLEEALEISSKALRKSRAVE